MSSEKKTPTPNDQRSTVKNPSSPQYWKAQGNRGKQLNPNQQGKGGTKKK